jgi:pyruvate dehydrogenase E2 component (dihydrolipoamide acetyltransferase)
MAATEIKLPDIGEGVNEGEIVRWLVKEGDSVAHDQALVEVMTDKATVEIPCSAAGKVVKILAKEGQVVKVGGALLSMETGGVASEAPADAESKKEPTPAKASEPPAPKTEPPPEKAPAPKTEPAPEKAPAPKTDPPAEKPAAVEKPQTDVQPPVAGANVLATPATRRFARESGVDLNQLKGSGPVGRVTRDDVIKAGTQNGSAAPGAVTNGAGATASPQSGASKALPAFVPLAKSEGEERKPFRGIRRKIAENLQRSKQIIPHFTHADECDVTELVNWRASFKDQALERGVKLTYLPFVLKAVAVTCKEFPNFSASIDDASSEIVIKHTINIGFAADTAEGLLVPVVKNVDKKSILEIGHDISQLAEKARTGKLASDDMRHGSLTVTNIGSIGGISATPIINHPEVCIIGVYKIQKKPVVVGNEIKIRDMMGVTATCDHRLIDGAQAARFLNKLMKRLENPQSLLLDLV